MVTLDSDGDSDSDGGAASSKTYRNFVYCEQSPKESHWYSDTKLHVV